MMTDTLCRSLNKMLEIALVTHDSATALGDTLQQLSESPFKNAKITIIDNCSNDDTQDVCSRYTKVFSDFVYFRYPKNIGKEAACLHAVEGLTAQYGWILCAEARYDFSSGHELIEAIHRNGYDALYVGSCYELGWRGDETCVASQLVAADTLCYRAFTSWSSLIFRTSLFNEECLVKGYRQVNNGFANFPFVNMLVEMNAKIFIASQHMVVSRVGNIKNIDNMYSYSAWVNCCQSIKNVPLREKVVGGGNEDGLLATVSAWISLDNEFGSKRFWNSFIDIFCGMPTWQRRELVILYAILIIPSPRIWRRSLLGWIASRVAAFCRKLPDDRQSKRPLCN